MGDPRRCRPPPARSRHRAATAGAARGAVAHQPSGCGVGSGIRRPRPRVRGVRQLRPLDGAPGRRAGALAPPGDGSAPLRSVDDGPASRAAVRRQLARRAAPHPGRSPADEPRPGRLRPCLDARPPRPAPSRRGAHRQRRARRLLRVGRHRPQRPLGRHAARGVPIEPPVRRVGGGCVRRQRRHRGARGRVRRRRRRLRGCRRPADHHRALPGRPRGPAGTRGTCPCRRPRPPHVRAPDRGDAGGGRADALGARSSSLETGVPQLVER